MQRIKLQLGSPFKLCSTGQGLFVEEYWPWVWNLQMTSCKCPGVPRGQSPGMAADKCIRERAVHMCESRLLSRM